MKTNLFLKKWKFLLSGILMITVSVIACKRELMQINTTSDVNITEYLLKNPDQFSEFSKIIELAGTDGVLAAYGTYTCFVPVNSAINVYLKEINKASVNAMSPEELKNLVKLHLIRDTIPSATFTDGRLRTMTMYGQYLITGAQNTGGVTRLLINRQASVLQADVRLGNGIIHVIDHVLKPAKLTLAEMIAQNPDYSIFTEALKATGVYESLNILPENNPADSAHKWLTVFAETNNVLKSAGINSYEDLKDKYSDTGNPASPADSLHLFVDYHILPGLKYLPDIFAEASHVTMSPLDVITSKLSGQTILINDDTFNGVHETGAQVNRPASDNTAANGVLHVMSNHYAIKIRFPIPVYWDVADQPEFRKLAGIFRVTNKSSAKFAPGDLQDIKWETGSLIYVVAPEARKFYVHNNEYLQFASLRTAVGGNNWIDFKTPLLVKGKYKVWISFIRRGGGNAVSVSFDGQALTRILNFTESLPGEVLVGNHWTYPQGTTPGSLEALGKKMAFGNFPYYNNPNQTIDYYRDSYALLAGTIDVKATDRHTLRLQAVADAKGDVQFNMIHFIPENEDQLWPKFNPDGEVVQKP